MAGFLGRAIGLGRRKEACAEDEPGFLHICPEDQLNRKKKRKTAFTANETTLLLLTHLLPEVTSALGEECSIRQ